MINKRRSSPFRNKDVRYWTPERIERVRKLMHMTVTEFRKKLRLSATRFKQIMRGNPVAMTAPIALELRRLTTLHRLDALPLHQIDWSNPDATFSLRMHLKKSMPQMGEAVGKTSHTISDWERSGIPKNSTRAWLSYYALAEAHGFDRRHVHADNDWSPEWLIRLIDLSERTRLAWAERLGVTYQTILMWTRGERNISREHRYHLSRTAFDWNLEMPPSLPMVLLPGEPDKEKWTIEALVLLGTMPDAVLAKKLKRRPATVAAMRRRLRLNLVPLKGWDGFIVPQKFSREEIERRFITMSKEHLQAKDRLAKKLPPVKEGDDQMVTD